jgi:hypothetical protein
VCGVELGHSPYWNFFRTSRHERLGGGWTIQRSSVPKACSESYGGNAVCVSTQKRIGLVPPALTSKTHSVFTSAGLYSE